MPVANESRFQRRLERRVSDTQDAWNQRARMPARRVFAAKCCPSRKEARVMIFASKDARQSPPKRRRYVVCAGGDFVWPKVVD